MTDERRKGDSRPRRGGRRWSDDPNLRDAYERLLVQLSQDVHTLRDRQDWSQDRLAAAVGLDPKTIGELEKARSDPHLSTLVRIAFVCGYKLRVVLHR